MAKIRGYIAASLDGFIAAPDDNLEWLDKYAELDFGQHDCNVFLNGIRTVVMGRRTYDFVANSASPWPYHQQNVIVVTSTPIETPPTNVVVRSVLEPLITELRNLKDGDVWIVGGGRLQMSFIERAALDEIEIYVMPELIGGGSPLFPSTACVKSMELISASTLDKGCVRLHYRF